VEPRRSAVIVASDEYSDPKLRRLRAPARDAAELSRVLADPAIGGFEVEVCLNEPEHKLRRKLSEFFANRSRDDLLLVHFSCHGLKDDDGNLYFATPETEIEHLDSSAVPSEFVNRQMRKSRSRRIALFLDCCYSGAFSRGGVARAGGGVELAERFDGQGQVVITASNAMEYAFEGEELTGEGTPSVFTTALVEGLESGAADRDGDDLISIDELYDYIYERVREKTPNQTPRKWVYDLQGELFIARNRNPRPVDPAELPVDLRHAMENPLAGVRIGAVGELENLLTSSSLRLAAAARLALETLIDDDSRAVSDAAAVALTRRAEGEVVGTGSGRVGPTPPTALPQPPSQTRLATWWQRQRQRHLPDIRRLVPARGASWFLILVSLLLLLVAAISALVTFVGVAGPWWHQGGVLGDDAFRDDFAFVDGSRAWVGGLTALCGAALLILALRWNPVFVALAVGASATAVLVAGISRAQIADVAREHTSIEIGSGVETAFGGTLALVIATTAYCVVAFVRRRRERGG
jgi:hypothetical protein